MKTTSIPALHIRQNRQLIAVTPAQASKLHCDHRDEDGLGARELNDLALYDAKGKKVAYVSYNGRVWLSTGHTEHRTEIPMI